MLICRLYVRQTLHISNISSAYTICFFIAVFQIPLLDVHLTKGCQLQV